MQNSYAETAVTLFGLGVLALGTLAMFVRFVLQRRHTLHAAGRQFVDDVKKGEGLTFHRKLTEQTNSKSDVIDLRDWLELVNRRPDQVPHLFIEGGSGAGKTTLATAILSDRPGSVAVVGVKPDDGWGAGYIYHSADRPAALATLLREVRRRLDEDDRSGLTIVLDDFTRLASSHREAVELYKEVADVGRSLRIRLILIARGRQVKGIGASGESDLLEHFVFLVVERGQHQVTLEMDEDAATLDTRQVRQLAQPLPATRWWKPQEELLTNLLAQEHRPDTTSQQVSMRPDRAGTAEHAAIVQFPAAEKIPASETDSPAQESDVTSSDVDFSIEEIAQIAALIARGEHDKTEIIKAMPRYSGRKYKSYSQFYERLRGAVEGVITQAA